MRMISLVSSSLAALCLVAGADSWQQAVAPPELRKVAWTPPKTTIPVAYVEATRALLGNGLSDPRGRKFAQVKVSIGDAAWGRNSAVSGFGWVSKSGSRAVLMDGLVYDVQQVVAVCDLARFLAGQLVLPRTSQSFNVSGITAATPALLLISGRADLAEKAFEVFRDGTYEPPESQLFNGLRQRYQMQAADMLKQKKDREGVRWATDLVRVLQIRDRLLPPKPDSFGNPPEPQLENAKVLLADLSRRSEHPKREPVDLLTVAKLPKEQRLAALAESLDTIAAHQWGQPGGLDYFEDPVVKAIVQEGQDAVPMLIGALEHDDRLTRSVSFVRDFFPERRVHSVRDVAWVMLTKLWPSCGALRMENPVATAKVLRSEWVKVEGLSEAERWLSVLRDDSAKPSSWLAAGRFLTRPVDEGKRGKPILLPAALKGEYLRAGYGTEITRLMGERAVKMADPSLNLNTLNLHQFSDALLLGHYLAKWDAKSAVVPLREVCAKTLDVAAKWRNSGYVASIMGDAFGRVIVDRANAGDSTAAADYASFGKLIDLTDEVPVFFYKPLWARPMRSDVLAAGYDILQRELRDLDSNDAEKAIRTAGHLYRLARTPLLTVAAYRAAVIKGIENKTWAGFGITVVERGERYVQYSFKRQGAAMVPLPKDAKGEVAPGVKVELCVGDFVAHTIQGASFVLSWPESKLATERAKIVEWLRDDSRDWQKVVDDFRFDDWEE